MKSKRVTLEKLDYLHNALEEEFKRFHVDDEYRFDKMEYIKDQISLWETELFKIETSEQFKEIEHKSENKTNEESKN